MNSTDLFCFAPGTLQLPATGSGALSGLHFAAKDIFAIRGHTASFGLARWRQTHTPDAYTAPVIKQLLAAGASLQGLTKLDQLCASLIGDVGEEPLPINPLYPDRFTGGSSSGSASAVAGGLVDFAIGSDTSGSIRVPAASCGLYSIRPSSGVIDKTGMLDFAPASDVVGILAREPSILTTVFEVLASPSSTPAKVSRVLLPATKDQHLDQEVYDTILVVGQALSKYKVDHVEYDSFVNEEVTNSYARIQCRDIWATGGKWTKPNLQYLAPDVRRRQLIAEDLFHSPKADQQADITICAAYKQYFRQFISHNTVAVLPITPDLPPRLKASEVELRQFRYPAFKYCSIGSITGCPEVVVPVRHPRSGATYGVGLLSAPGNDHLLLNLAKTLHKSLAKQ